MSFTGRGAGGRCIMVFGPRKGIRTMTVSPQNCTSSKQQQTTVGSGQEVQRKKEGDVRWSDEF